MPTARELLEQADALMRRNRLDQGDDIPVLTDAVPSLAEAPMRALAQTPGAVAAEAPRSGGPSAPLQPGHGSAHEGEPSDWLEIEDAEPSVIGEAPDSVAIVPPVDVRRAADEELLQSAEHEEIELTSAEDDPLAPDEVPPPLPTPPAVDKVGQWSGADALLAVGEPGATEVFAAQSDDGRHVESVEASRFVEDSRMAEVAEQGPSAGIDGLALAAAPADPAEPPVTTPSAAALAATFTNAMPAAPMSVSLGPDTRWPVPTAPSAPTQDVPSEDSGRASAVRAAPLGPDDQAHWDSVAEEIRMQVLQRIDLFTDTGLREQLGERLKPIVDRASADLVATINQHVGELLRAYVAEAIEREIERWRQDN